MKHKHFKNSGYIVKAIKRDKLQHIIVETGEKNIYIPQESKFIVTKDFLVDKIGVFANLYYQDVKTIDLTNFDFSEITTMEHWFEHSYTLEKVIFPRQMNMPNFNNLSSIFYSCKELQEVDFNWISTNSQVKLNKAFCDCEKLKKLTLPKCKAISVSSIVQNASQLQKVTLPIELTIKENFDLRFMNMFRNCVNLKLIDVSEAKLINNKPETIYTFKDLLEKKNNTFNVHKDCVVLLPDVEDK